MRFILSLPLLICSFTLHASEQINVYLKFNNPRLTQEVQQFNSYLKTHNIFSKYDIKPFLEKHPLHITLYLADYEPNSLEKIKNAVAHLAKEPAAITIHLHNIYITPSHYVMLGINPSLTEEPYSALQQLSDKTVISLASLRDSNAAIPAWAEIIPTKKKAFATYGSPNVFFEYDPHFTLMAKEFTNPDTARAFQHEMQTLIEKYRIHQVKITATDIGIGYVNPFGQITKEIASYPVASFGMEE